jgi:hypothetical protein
MGEEETMEKPIADVLLGIVGVIAPKERRLVPPSSGRNAENLLHDITHLATTAQVIEGRLLRLIRGVAQGSLSLDGFLSELSPLAHDLQRCLREVTEMKERRDLTFKAFEDLREIDRQCIWLYRKMHLEKAFFLKLNLETQLRGAISADAFGVYEELLDAEDQERTLLAQGGAEIRKLLLTESPASPKNAG